MLHSAVHASSTAMAASSGAAGIDMLLQLPCGCHGAYHEGFGSGYSCKVAQNDILSAYTTCGKRCWLCELTMLVQLL